MAGEARGRRLVAPRGGSVRPTADRVRGAIFNALTSLEAAEDLAVLEGADVLDLFAGSGALGIEALSRGAARVTFVDESSPALAAVRKNLAACGFDDRAAVRRSDALGFLAARASTAVAEPESPEAGGTEPRRPGPWDLALLDPPYGFRLWDDLLDALDSTVIVVESDRPVDPPPRWTVVRRRSYGATVVTIAVGRPTPRPGGPTT